MYNNKKILGIVMARAGSKGLINKNLRKINKLSLVGHAGKLIKRINIIDKAIISTDSIKIGREGKKNNLIFFFKRSKKLSGPTVCDEEVLYDGLLRAERYFKFKFDIIISIPPTSPLRKYQDVRKAIVKCINNKHESLWTVSKTDSKFHPHKSLLIKKKLLCFFSKKGKKIKYRQQLNQLYHRNGVAYVVSRSLLLKKKLLSKNTGYLVINSQQVSIDNLADLNIVKKIMK
jgi:CMP-N-acetylneuraminic acid synthetase